MKNIKVLVGVSDEHKRDLLSKILVFCLRFFFKAKEDYSHIFIVYKDEMYHAIEEGVCKGCFKEYQKTHHIRVLKEVQLNCDEETFLKHFKHYKGTPYTKSQVLSFVPVLGKLFDNDRKKMWCSEYVGVVLNDLAGLWDFADADQLTPTMIERL